MRFVRCRGGAVNQPAQTETSGVDPAAALEDQTDAAIAVCDGDIRAALQAALVANAFLMEEVHRLRQAVSRGYTRGRTPARGASDMLDRWREISKGELPQSDEEDLSSSQLK
jgi:hypothetical protein